jgi:hypothetical protein
MPKTTQRILRGLLVLLVALIVFVTGVLVFGGHDIPPPDVSDLLPRREPIADADNAYTHFCAATNALYWPEYVPLGATPPMHRSRRERAVLHTSTNDIPAAPRPEIRVKRLDEHVRAILNGSTNDDAFVQAILASNRVTLAELDLGLACRHLQMPQVDGYQETSSLFPKSMQRIGLLLALGAKLDQRQGRYTKSLQNCLRLLKLAVLLSDDPGSLSQLVYYGGVPNLSSGCWRVRCLAYEQGTTAAQLSELLQQLGKTPSVQEAIALALSNDFRLNLNLVDTFSSGSIPVWQLDCLCDNPYNFLSYPGIRKLNGRTVPRYFFQRNRTVALVADHYQATLRQLPLPYAGMTIPDPLDEFSETRRFWWQVIGSNFLGTKLLSSALPSMHDALLASCKTECMLSATRLVLACCAYSRTHGEWPPTLDALVPTYLDCIPRDPYDGAQFRYSRKEAIIYSVGSNLKDDGGSDKLPPNARKYEGYVLRRGVIDWRSDDIVYPLTLEEGTR